eukprot:1929164-Amphidinium_carterae.1
MSDMRNAMQKCQVWCSVWVVDARNGWGVQQSDVVHDAACGGISFDVSSSNVAHAKVLHAEPAVAFSRARAW